MSEDTRRDDAVSSEVPQKGIVFSEQGLRICREIVAKEYARNPEGVREAFEALGFDPPESEPQ